MVQWSMARYDATATSVELLERLAVEKRPILRDTNPLILEESK